MVDKKAGGNNLLGYIVSGCFLLAMFVGMIQQMLHPQTDAQRKANTDFIMNGFQQPKPTQADWDKAIKLEVERKFWQDVVDGLEKNKR